MIDRVQIVALVISIALLVAVLELVRRRKLAEEYSLLWIAGAVALIVLAAWRHVIDTVAGWIGVYYPPILLLLVLIVMVFVALLWFSVIVSRQRRQIERLIEETAILSAELRELRHPTRSSEPPRARLERL